MTKFVSSRSLAQLLACTISMLSLTGCATASLSTVGTILGSAGAAASAGPEVFSLGKLDFSAAATFDQARSAAVDAVHETGLQINECNFAGKRTDKLVIHLQDALGGKIDMIIDRRAAHLVQIEIDVGIFGFEPTAKLLMDHIRHHLPDPAREVSNTAH